MGLIFSSAYIMHESGPYDPFLHSYERPEEEALARTALAKPTAATCLKL